MSAKAYCKKTAAFAGFLIQNVPADLTDEAMDGWMNNSDAMKKFLSGLKPSVASGTTLTVFKTVTLSAVAGKKTRDCMTEKKRWAYRDSDLDGWLPSEQRAMSAGAVTVHQLQSHEGTTFREMAATVLGVGANTGWDLIASALKEHGLTLTLSAIEALVDRQEAGEDVGLRSDSYPNFAFIEDADGSVSAANFRRLDRRWDVRVSRLFRVSRWSTGSRLLVSNSVPASL